MKDKYFGDIHDFLKYTLLRFLQDRMQWSIFINWMLTTYEPRNSKKENKDGGQLNYEKLRSINEDIFQSLAPYRIPGAKRSVMEFKNLCPSVLNNTIQAFEKDYVYEEIVPPKSSNSRNLISERIKWCSEFYQKSKDFDLVFFDSDNGLQVDSIPLGQSKACKYVFLKEIKCIFERKQNVLLYQHRNRQKYDVQLDIKKKQLSQLLPNPHISVFNGKGTFFLLATHSEDQAQDISELSVEWNNRLSSI